ELEVGALVGEARPVPVEDVAVVVVLRHRVARRLPGRPHQVGALGDAQRSDDARSLISSTTAGSASVVVSPSSRFSATSRRRRRLLLPLRVVGRSGVKTIFAGFAMGPIFFATWLRSSSSFSTEPSAWPLRVT